jgi:ATP-binding cassette, subfamily B (MDR/TAP), member 1
MQAQECQLGIKENKEINKNISVGFFKLQYQFLHGIDYLILFWALLGSIGTGISLPLFALFFGETVSELNNITSPDQFVDYFRLMCLKFVYVGLGTLIAGILMVSLWTYNGRTITKRLREDYFKVIMRQEQGFFDSMNPHQFCFKIQNQIHEIENGLGQKVGNSIFAITMFVSSFVVGYYTSWKLSLVISSVIPVFLIGGWLISKLLKRNSVKVEETFGQAGGIAEEVIYHIKTVASFANFEYEETRYNTKIDINYKASISHGKYSSIFIGIYLFLLLNTFSLAIWYGSVLIVNKEPNTHAHTPMYVADILVVIFVIVFGSLALGQAGPNIKALSNACVAAYDYFELTKRIPEMDLTQSNKIFRHEELVAEVEFRDVYFFYKSKPDKIVLQNLNLKILEKKKIAIVGESGAGKTTVACLIERLYDSSSGQIFFSGINIKEYDLNFLRSLIVYAPQEPVLFNTTIRENIIFGRENVTEEEIWSALKSAYADDFVKEKGLDYLVGIKGGKLSCGQRQRVALARAFLKKPMLFILDEATSSLDYKSEKMVQMAIDKMSKECTILIIANRLSTIKNSDYIYVLHSGKISEEGSHDSLLQKDGLYAALIKNQLDLEENRWVRLLIC